MSIVNNPVIQPQDRPLYHLTLKANLPRISAEGCVRARGAPGLPYTQEIWPEEFLAARAKCVLPFAARLSLDLFVPFTFCAKTPAAYNVATGYNGIVRRPNRELIFLRTTSRRLLEAMIPVVCSDRMPLKRDTVFTAGISSIGAFDWTLINSGLFHNDPADPNRSARVAAEILAYKTVPFDALDAIVCWDEIAAREMLEEADVVCGLPFLTDRRCFFPKGA